jgi:LAO/AO transport system kinase
MRKRLPPEAYIDGILAHDRYMLSRAITLIESELPADQPLAQAVLNGVLPYTANSVRIGITGVPGVGKSTFIEAFGKMLTHQGLRLAVLAVDPSSQRTGGSILGDKTRMEQLANDPLAYIRPSAAGKSLGGVNRKTRESMLLCEAAGFEVVIIETVGVGQSETLVSGMTDFFLLLMLAGAGDELQGIKRGIMEMADCIAVTKADSGNEMAARRAAAQYQQAIHLFPLGESAWTPPVLTCSALTKNGLARIWETIDQYRRQTQANGYWTHKRQQQQLHWLQDTIREALEEAFYRHPTVSNRLETVKNQVLAAQLSPTAAAAALLQHYRQ